MAVNPDFRDLFAALNDAGVRYLLVGGYAVSFHAEPRFTKDLDIWVEAGRENARHVFAALEDFGAPLHDLNPADLEKPDLIFQIGVAPNRIDLVTGISPLSHLSRLKWLTLSDNQVQDMSPLQGLERLTRVELYNNSLNEVSRDSYIPTLREKGVTVVF